MRAFFLLTVLLGAVAASEISYHDDQDELDLFKAQPLPTGEPATYKAQDSTGTTQQPSSYSTQESSTQTQTTPQPDSLESEEDSSKSPSDYVVYKEEEPTAGPTAEEPTEYAAGRTYIHGYEAQILTGNPEMSSQYTGYQLRCRILLTMLPRRRVLMRIRNIAFGQANRVFPVRRPVVFMPANLFNRLPYNQDYQNIKRMLSIPVSFLWTESGWVKEIRVSKKDNFWSLNLKKGIMTMLNFNVRFNPQDINQKTNGIFKRTKYYEDGIDGHCKASYEYRRYPYTLRTKGKPISITKTRDLGACTQKPWFNHMLFLPNKCGASRNPIFAKSKTVYKMIAHNNQFFLKNIRTSSQYSYNERDIKDGSITSFVVQRFWYIKKLSASKEHLRSDAIEAHSQGLMMEIPIPEWENRKTDSPKRLAVAKLQAVQILRKYLRDDLDMYENMRYFIQIVRRLSKNDILSLLTKMQQEPEMQSCKNKDLFHNIISKAATKEVVQAILKIIQQRSQPDETTAMLVSRLSGMSFVNSGKMIKQMMDVANVISSPKQKQTYKALLFTIGKLINTHYEMPIPNPPGKNGDMVSRSEIKNFYQKQLNKRSRVLSKNMQQLVVLGSMKNCGLAKPCLDLIEPYTQPKYNDRRQVPRVIRATALFALFDIAPKAPQQVRKIVLPILYDLREDVELRISAFEVFMMTNPGMSDLKLISQFLTSEPVRQLRTYIATYLDLISRTKDRCLAPLALNATRILREVAPEIAKPEGMQFSRILGLQVPFEEKVAFIFNSLKYTPKNFLPRQINLGFFAKAFGLTINSAGVGIRAEDAQRLLDRLMGPDGTARTMKSLKELLKPITGGSKIDTDYMAGISMYNGLYGISGLSKEVTDALKKGLIPVPQDLYRLATQGGALQRSMETLSFFDQQAKIPTSFGVPMTVNHTLTGHLKLKAVVVVKPKLLSPVGTVSVRTKVAASYRHTLQGGPDMTIISSYVEAMQQGHVPRVTSGIKLGWKAPRTPPNLNRVLFRINLERPQQDKKVFHLSGRLVTAQWSQARPFNPFFNHMQHRSLPVPKTSTIRVATSKPLGLAVDCQHRILNFTGIQPYLSLPLYAPRDIKIMLRRTSNVGGSKGVDFTGQVMLTRTNLRSILVDVPRFTANGSMETDELFSRRESSDEALWEEKPDQDDNQQKPTEEPSQMFTPIDDSPQNSGPVSFSEGRSDNVEAKNSSSNDQPELFSGMSDDERKDYFASQRRLKSVLVQMVMRLDNLPLDGKPTFKLGNQGVIWRGQVRAAALRKWNGFSFSVLCQKRIPKMKTFVLNGVALANNAIMNAKFNERYPLRLIEKMIAHFSVSLRVNGKFVGFLHNTASMGNMWKNNIKRIIRNWNKQLPAFPEVQHCQKDIKKGLFGTPGCYQAWKDINALSKIQSYVHISEQAPEWLKQASVMAFNYLRWSQIDALRVTKYVQSNKNTRIRGDWELSPYNQRLVSGYQRFFSLWDRYVNARLLISRRNSITEKPATSFVSNVFDGLYPARCEVVRRGVHMTWRTFDHVHHHAVSKLANRPGRVVLVQDLKNRLLVTEQRVYWNRITHIRLRYPWQHVLIVSRVGSLGRVQVPRVFWRGKFRRLPFKLYNRKRQVIMNVYQDPTSRTRFSLTAVLPKVGCTVRTNPAVSTEIRLSPFFHSNVRGICGDFNGEKLDDPKGPMCRAVFPHPQTFLRRHTTLLRGWPNLKNMEKIPAMYNFMKASQCPDTRHYPVIVR